MTDDPMQRVRATVREWASFTPQVSRVWLYGSRIRGQTWRRKPVRPESDLDIAVEVFEPDRLEPHYRKGWEQLLQTVIPWQVQLELYEGAEGTPTVHRAITDCSELVYSRTVERP